MKVVSHIIMEETASFRSEISERIDEALVSYIGIKYEFNIDKIIKQHDRYLVRFSIDFTNELEGDDNGIIEEIFNSISVLYPSASEAFGLLKFYDAKQLEINTNLYAEVYKIEMSIREVLFYILWNKYGDKDIYNFLSRFGANYNIDKSKKNTKTYDHQLFYIMFSRYKEFTKFKNLNTFSSKDPEKNEFLTKILDKYHTIDELLIKLKSIWIDNSAHIALLSELFSYLDSIENLRNAIAHNRHIEQNIIDNGKLAIESTNELIDRFWHDEAGLKEIDINPNAEKIPVEEIVEWFLDNYMDPANGVPYDSTDGGYMYCNGGPYYAEDEILDHFPNLDEDIVGTVVREVEYECDVWVKIDEY